jgi:hypothetical protein
MTKVVYKRCSLTLDTETIRKSKELANQKAQSVSSFVRYLVGQAYEEAAGPQRHPVRAESQTPLLSPVFSASRNKSPPQPPKNRP